MSESPLQKSTIDTSYGKIAYLETGTSAKPPVLFVHGIPTSSYLWREVIKFLQNDFHCFAPDLMGLGDTIVDPASTRFHMDSQAEMLIEFMEKLGHTEFSIVCHDQGGAAAQIIAANTPQKVTRLVLTDCVCYDNWPVPAIKRLQDASQFKPLMNAFTRLGISEWIETKSRFSSFKKGVFNPERLTTETIQEYLRPMKTAEGRERFRAFLMAGHPSYTQQAVHGLKQFKKPTAVIWGGDDFYLSPSWGRKLYEDIPGAQLFRIVPFCGHFWQEERPSEFASVMGEFLAKPLQESAADETAAAARKRKAACADDPKAAKKKKVALPVAEDNTTPRAE